MACLVVACSLSIGCINGCTDDASSAAHDPPIDAVDAAGGSPPEKSPDNYWVKLDTTRGNVIVAVHRAWSPVGADRFYELVKSGFYDGCKFFRVVSFVVQFGISGDPQMSAKWRNKNIPDDKFKRGDPNRQSNKRGYVTFAKDQVPNSRTTQVFINSIDNARLDTMGFTPFGEVISGMPAIDALYGGYEEEPSSPSSQDRIEREGNAYLEQAFPRLDSIKSATILPKKPPEATQADEAKKVATPKAGSGQPAPAKKGAG
jgi:peptidyl-prolyl cis-trans isomerase A (cyclophilin A)